MTTRIRKTGIVPATLVTKARTEVSRAAGIQVGFGMPRWRSDTQEKLDILEEDGRTLTVFPKPDYWAACLTARERDWPAIEAATPEVRWLALDTITGVKGRMIVDRSRRARAVEADYKRLTIRTSEDVPREVTRE